MTTTTSYRIPALLLVLLTMVNTTLMATGEILPLQAQLPQYKCVDYNANRLHYPADSTAMQRFYHKLDSLALFGDSHINIVQIGGSHIQADVFSDRLRCNLTSMLPGFQANRGAIFPFKAAKTNNPTNYNITHTGEWTKSQNSLPPIAENIGIMGYTISTTDTAASISFNLNPNGTSWQYNRLRLFASTTSDNIVPLLVVDQDTLTAEYDSVSYLFTLPSLAQSGTIILGTQADYTRLNNKPIIYGNVTYSDSIININNDTLTQIVPTADTLETGMENNNGTIFSDTVDTDSVSPIPMGKFCLMGLIPENDLNGITLHALGANGASLPSWLRCCEFARQMQYLHPDLMILGVGVNDANVAYGDFDVAGYKERYRTLIARVRASNPNCAIIFVTNNDCIYRVGRRVKGINRNTKLVQKAIYELAKEYNAAVWDLFSIMGGTGSVYQWVDVGLCNRDKIHFTVPGYNLLGDMLYNAIIYDWLYK